MIREFTIHILQSIHFLQNIEPIPDSEVQSRSIDFKFKKKGVSKLLIFDLDETLAHCVRQEKPDRPPDVRLDIRLQSGKTIKAGFNVRPLTIKLLEAVSKYYEIAVFTASHKWYADVILDHIDPKGIFF
jgi:TFIIF-interacting CTD phosphatase-like protein